MNYKTNLRSMHQRKAILLLALMQTMIFIAVGQNIDTGAINVQLKNNQAIFSSELGPLHQVCLLYTSDAADE